MIIDGKQIANDIKAQIEGRIEKMASKPALTLVQVGDDKASTKFVAQKCKFGKETGVLVDIVRLPSNISAEDIASKVALLDDDPAVQGIVLQLPLPPSLDPEILLALISAEKDPDALSNAPMVPPPVVAAVDEIFKKYNVVPNGKRAIVIGRGRLVGAPVAKWLKQAGAEVEVLGRETPDIARHTLRADIIVSGAGVPNLITPNMIKSGVVLIDAGTSEDGGKLVGDIDPACAQKASLYTPVPGGVGPITVAMLFQNLVDLTS